MSMNILEDQCSTCYRTFNPDVLKKHIPICLKVNTKVRKPLDTQKQRIAGTDIKLPKKTAKHLEEKPKKGNWKEKHEQFVQNIRYAREAKAAEARGEQAAPPPPSQIPSDHVECPTCGRSFSRNAAERHIKFCAEQAKRRPANNRQAKSVATTRREKMMGFKSTFDKRKQQQQQSTKNRDYNPSNYGAGGAAGGAAGVAAGGAAGVGAGGAAGVGAGVPQSRTLRATENKSAPTPHRTGTTNSRYSERSEEESQRPEKRLLNNLNARMTTTTTTTMNGGPPNRKVSSARGPGSNTGNACGEAGSRNPPFCYECGIKYPVKTAKFCCECGSPKHRNDR